MLNKTTISKIIELNNYYNKIDTEAGIELSDNSKIIFNSLHPIQKGELMNLFRDRNFQTAYKNNSLKKIKQQCELQILKICNDK
jgi:hypothetical protein